MTLNTKRKLHLAGLVASEMRLKRCRRVCKSQNVCPHIKIQIFRENSFKNNSSNLKGLLSQVKAGASRAQNMFYDTNPLQSYSGPRQPLILLQLFLVEYILYVQLMQK